MQEQPTNHDARPSPLNSPAELTTTPAPKAQAKSPTKQASSSTHEGGESPGAQLPHKHKRAEPRAPKGAERGAKQRVEQDEGRRKTNRKEQSRTQQPPDNLQDMSGILATLPLESDPARPGLRLNRYGFFSVRGGARNYGYFADIYVALVRIVDRLRMDHAVDPPEFLRSFSQGDRLTPGQLFSSFLGEHPIWSLDVGCFAAISWAHLSEDEFKLLLKKCLKANFRFRSFLIAERRWNDCTDLSTDVVKTATNRAFVKRECWKKVTTPTNHQMARCAGWSNKTAQNWEDAADAVSNRMTQITPHNCVKGGSHV